MPQACFDELGRSDYSSTHDGESRVVFYGCNEFSERCK
jgi:hypothetical protein